MKIIKGCPIDKWNEVQAAQYEPFIYISSLGSRWGGEEPGDIADMPQCGLTAKPWPYGLK